MGVNLSKTKFHQNYGIMMLKDMFPFFKLLDGFCTLPPSRFIVSPPRKIAIPKNEPMTIIEAMKHPGDIDFYDLIDENEEKIRYKHESEDKIVTFWVKKIRSIFPEQLSYEKCKIKYKRESSRTLRHECKKRSAEIRREKDMLRLVFHEITTSIWGENKVNWDDPIQITQSNIVDLKIQIKGYHLSMERKGFKEYEYRTVACSPFGAISKDGSIEEDEAVIWKKKLKILACLMENIKINPETIDNISNLNAVASKIQFLYQLDKIISSIKMYHTYLTLSHDNIYQWNTKWWIMNDDQCLNGIKKGFVLQGIDRVKEHVSQKCYEKIDGKFKKVIYVRTLTGGYLKNGTNYIYSDEGGMLLCFNGNKWHVFPAIDDSDYSDDNLIIYDDINSMIEAHKTELQFNEKILIN